MEQTAWLRDTPLNFEQWEKYSDKEPYLIDKKYPVPGLRQVCYQKETSEGLVSAGVFTLNGKLSHIAWGMKEDKNCSFHKIVQPDGSWGPIQEGCADVATITGFELPACESGISVVEFMPLALSLGTVAVFAFLCSILFHGGFMLHAWMQYFMSGFFLLFGALQLVNLRSFARTFAEYDLLARYIPFWGQLYPFAELTLGMLYFFGVLLTVANYITLFLMLVGAVGIVLRLQKKGPATCACLGAWFALPLTWITVAEDLLMAGMAAAMLISY